MPTLARPSNAQTSFQVHDVKPLGPSNLYDHTGKRVTQLALGPQHKLIDCSGRLEPRVLDAHEPKYKNGKSIYPNDQEAIRAYCDSLRPYHNDFLHTIHLAFASHLPLTLSPDVIHIVLCLSQARWNKHHSKSPKKKEEIVVETLSLSDKEERWEDFVHDFSKQVSSREPDARFYECDFSTTTPREATVARIAMLDAFSLKYDYTIKCICGIPTVTLTGHPDDWRKLRDNAVFLCKDKTWQTKVDNILQQFVKASDGYPEIDFWRDIYKTEKGYGTASASGWIAHLFPLLSISDFSHGKSAVVDAEFVPNPLVFGWENAKVQKFAIHDFEKDEKGRPLHREDTEEEKKERLEREATGNWSQVSGEYVHRFDRVLEAVHTNCFPISLSSAPVMANKRPVVVTGGIIGMAQDKETKALEPKAGWAVSELI